MNDELEKLRAENALLRTQNASAAVLRQAFNEAASAYSKSLSKGRVNGWDQEPGQVWARLYDAITSTTGGLFLLAELENLREKLKCESQS